MKKRLSEYLKDYYEYSGKASDVTRTAAYAGIALVWVFRLDGHPSAFVPLALLVPAACFGMSIACDVLQYVAGTITWYVFHRFHEKETGRGADPMLDHATVLVWPMNFFFWLKIAAVVVGYVSVFDYLRKIWLGV